MKYIVLILAVLSQAQFYFSSSLDSYFYISPQLLDNYDKDLHHKEIYLELETFLKQALENNKQVALYLGTTDNCYCPWHEKSLAQELDRTAMAIASSFYRVNPSSKIQVIECEKNKFDLSNLDIFKAMDFSELDFDTRVKQFKNECVRKLEIKRSNKNIELQKIDISLDDSQETLESKLPELQVDQRRMLVLGGAGFIGSHLVDRLLADGYQVIILDNNFCSSFDNIKHLKDNKNCAFIKWDATRNYTFNETITDILHLASVPSPEFYYQYPLETLRTGLKATEYAINLAVKHKAKLLFTSTSEFYGDPEINPQPEEYAGRVSCYGKRSQYDQSKRCAEAYLNYIADKENLDIRVVRIFNTYGPRMLLNDGRVITNFIKSFRSGEPFYIHGSGNQSRSFCYVDDLVDGIVRLLYNQFPEDSSVKDKTINIGNDTEMSINDACFIMNEVVSKEFGRICDIKYIPAIDSDDPKQRRPDLTKSREALGYNPQKRFVDGFREMIKYYL